MPQPTEDGDAEDGVRLSAVGVRDNWREVRWALVLLGWAVIALLGLFALLRIVAWDSADILIVVNALTLIVYLPAWLVAAGAAIGRRWWLLGAAGLVIAAQVAFVAPEFFAASPLPDWARHAPTIRMFDANIDKSLTFAPGYLHAIASDHPDVISFEEFTPLANSRLAASGILRSFPYRCSAPAYGATGFFVASRWRLSGCRIRTVQWDGLPTPYVVEGTLQTPGGSVSLWVVHTLAPLPSYWHEWKAAFAALDNSVQAVRTNRILMVGDFNASWGNQGFNALLGRGMTDGAAARGDALDMTWPNGAIAPPFVRIDHVLTGSSLAVVRISTGPGFGSDHRSLSAVVAVRR